MSDGIHPYLKRAVYVFAGVTLVVLCVVSVAWLYMDNAAQQKQEAERALKIWKNRVDASSQSNTIIDTYEDTYLDLVNHNVIGEEDRLSWYETIRATSEERGMPSVKYSVTSQVQVNPREVAKVWKGLDLYRSVMTMDIRMSHEGDLFALLNNLAREANGLYVVDACDVERIDFKVSPDSTGLDNMKAWCELSWYTIRASQARKS
jgi:hypothetical protein